MIGLKNVVKRVLRLPANILVGSSSNLSAKVNNLVGPLLRESLGPLAIEEPVIAAKYYPYQGGRIAYVLDAVTDDRESHRSGLPVPPQDEIAPAVVEMLAVPPETLSRYSLLGSSPLFTHQRFKSLEKGWHRATAFDSAELGLSSEQTGCTPALPHITVTPSSHPGSYSSCNTQGRFNGVGRRQGTPQRPRYAQAYYRQRLLQPFTQARSRVGIDPRQPVGRILERRLGGFIVALLIGCTKPLVQLWQMLLWYVSLHVPLLVDLASLDYGVLAPEPSRRCGSALEPSSTNNVGCAVSSPRCCRSSNSSTHTAAFSVAP